MKKQNNIKKLISLTKYNFLSTMRNPSALFFGFLFPLIFILVFGLLGQSSGKYEVGVLSSSQKSGSVYETLTKIEALQLITDKNDDELKDALKKGQLAVLVSVSQNAETQKVTIDLQTSSASPQGGAIVSNILENITNSINGQANPNAVKVASLNIVNVEGRRYNQIDFILPGQLNFSLLTTGVFTITFSLLTLRKMLVLKRMYATPTPKGVILMSKVLSSMMVALLQASLIIAVGHFAFGFTLVNGLLTYLSMLFLALIGLIVFLGLGLVVSSLADSEDAVSPIANLVTLPQLILSGAFFPIDAFPDFLQTIARLLPMTFLNDAMRSVAFEGASLIDVWPKMLGLAVWGIITYVVAVRIFKWE